MPNLRTKFLTSPCLFYRNRHGGRRQVGARDVDDGAPWRPRRTHDRHGTTMKGQSRAALEALQRDGIAVTDTHQDTCAVHLKSQPPVVLANIGRPALRIDKLCGD